MTVAIREGDTLAAKYRVEKCLGTGGMGTVVAARHLELEQRVAIKLMHPHLAEHPESVTRFLREGQAAGRLRSDHVARVLDVGRLENGAPYLVMEYLEGKDLDTLTDEHGALSLEKAATYLLQACEAVAEAHAAGIVHRDLKPSNLFLTLDPYGQPKIKVLDFGISKLSQEGSTTGHSDGSITVTAAIMGSPLYMPPEQMRSARQADARSDIWALGAVLYELLTVRHVWSGSTVSEICVRAATDPTPSVCAVRADLPREVDAIVARCLEKEPALRFQSAAELASALAPLAGAAGKAALERVLSMAGNQDPGLAHDSEPRASCALAPPGVGRPGSLSIGEVFTEVTWGAITPHPPQRRRWPIKRMLGAAVLAGIGSLVVLGGVIGTTPTQPASSVSAGLASVPASVTGPPREAEHESMPAVPSTARHGVMPKSDTPVASAQASVTREPLGRPTLRHRASRLVQDLTQASRAAGASSTNTAASSVAGKDGTAHFGLGPALPKTPDWGGRK
jgi:serine/threonine protein kinase